MNNTENNMALCPNCETGRKDYLLDKGSLFCTYINCRNDGTCSMYVPLTGNCSAYQSAENL